MARRKQKTDPVTALLSLVMFFAFLLTFIATESIWAAIVALVIPLSIYLVILNIVNQAREERLKRSGIDEIDKMSGRQFELYLGHVFKAQGYKVDVTKSAGDFGADLVLSKDGRKVVIQAKRYSKNVGIKAVQEAQAAIAHYGAAEAWVISNIGYTDAAITLARSNNVRLIDRVQLIEMGLKLNPMLQKTAQESSKKTAYNEEQICKRCGSQMVRRNGPKGEFYGCSNYPKCRNIIPATRDTKKSRGFNL